MDPRADRSPAQFRAPATATPLRGAATWLWYAFIAIGSLIAAAAMPHETALWPSPMQGLSVVALAALVALANGFGTFQTVEGLAEYESLAMTVCFAMLLVLEWPYFVAAVALGEALTFLSEFLRRKHPTMWYIRCFNVVVQVASGAAAAVVMHAVWRLVMNAGVFLDAGIAATLVLSAVTWKVVDSVGTGTLIALATDRPIWAVRQSFRTFLAQYALFLIAIPFARLWYENVWLSAFALAPLGVAYRLLGLPELEHRVRTDERTGVTNAVAFDRVLERALDHARERGGRAALLAIDIDHFKRVNDTFGHPAGDAVIAQFADILGDLVRRDDVAARTGGEEFAILLDDGDESGALAFAERIRGRIEMERFHADGLEISINITASIGVALYPEDGATTRDLRKAADVALYAAKNGGRNAVRAVAVSS